ncbi:hypothetical protein [Mesorhizobium sp. WSM2561]|uniref:hypothetical protein n=1 Tax=Mesorhizobium sp. WSM2561 TaxID=1040985 RepID=UPI0004847D4C|nr:hypothetical protein [Mesorhizobium sp. WSM2561]
MKALSLSKSTPSSQQRKGKQRSGPLDGSDHKTAFPSPDRHALGQPVAISVRTIGSTKLPDEEVPERVTKSIST